MNDDEGKDATEANIDSQLLQEVNDREIGIKKLLVARNKAGALNLALQSPPVSAKTNEIKEKNLELVSSVIVTIPDNELNTVISNMDNDTCDVLMKYLYRFMEKNMNCSVVLKLHALIVEKVGIGCVVRAMSDRKTV